MEAVKYRQQVRAHVMIVPMVSRGMPQAGARKPTVGLSRSAEQYDYRAWMAVNLWISR